MTMASNCGSRTAPMITSCPVVTMRWTWTPSMGPGARRSHVVEDGREAVRDLARLAQVEQHAARLALVDDVSGEAI